MATSTSLPMKVRALPSTLEVVDRDKAVAYTSVATGRATVAAITSTSTGAEVIRRDARNSGGAERSPSRRISGRSRSTNSATSSTAAPNNSKGNRMTSGLTVATWSPSAIAMPWSPKPARAHTAPSAMIAAAGSRSLLDLKRDTPCPVRRALFTAATAPATTSAATPAASAAHSAHHRAALSVSVAGPSSATAGSASTQPTVTPATVGRAISSAALTARAAGATPLADSSASSWRRRSTQ